MDRKPARLYLDPLDAVWLTVAHRVGFGVERSDEVYAATDGKGRMTIGTRETLDTDDCLAQMVLHELCHSLVEGRSSLDLPDFGLDNETTQDTEREHACLRLQAWLTAPHGLRDVLAPTTDFRRYYEQLGPDSLAGDELAAARAREGARRSAEAPWAPHLQDGLTATAAILRIAEQFQAMDPSSDLPPIWKK